MPKKSKANRTTNEKKKTDKSKETNKSATLKSSKNLQNNDDIANVMQDNGNIIDHNTSGESDDFLNSAFVQSIKGKHKLKVNNTESSKNNLEKSSHSGALFHSAKTNRPIASLNKASHSLDRREYLKIIGNLSKYIDRHPRDVCSYINRSFYNLCVGNYVEALNDTNYVITHSNDKMLLSKMKCRQGQALWGLKRLDSAEQCFKESLNFYSESLSVQCEALRMRIERLKDMGFTEKHIMTVLTQISTINLNDAAAILTASEYDDDDYGDDDVDDGIYQSDDENNMSNTTMFIKKLQLDTKPEDTTWYDAMKAVNPQTIIPQKTNKDSKPILLKVLNTCGRPKTPPKVTNINARGIWVGNINSEITENTLMKAFSKFGKVAFVRKPAGQRYAFVNFTGVGSADQAVAAGSIEINGNLKPIKVNTVNY